MKTFLILWARELGVFFHASATYIMLAVFTAMTGLVFWKVTEESVGVPFDPAVLLFGPVYFWLMIVILTSVIAMRLFAEDRRTGILETILTAPVTDWQIVLAKYAGAMTVFGVACLPLVGYPLLLDTLRRTTGVQDGIPWAPLTTGFLVLFLCGALLNGIGVLCAAVLKGPVSTVIAVFVACSLLFVIDQAAAVTQNMYAAQTLNAIALTPAIRDFSRGIVDTRPIILWVSAIFFCLFSAQRALLLHRATRRY